MSARMNNLQIEEAHLKLICEILKPYPFKFYVFGSRAKRTAKKLSDLDLCIKEDIPKATLRSIQRQFEDSNLPYKVDILLWAEISKDFRRQIEKDLLQLNL